MSADIRRIGVVGAGAMGAGIAQVFAQAGFQVDVVDVTAAALDGARRILDRSLGRFVEKGTITRAAHDDALGRLSFGAALEQVAAADFIVEAIVERADAKRALFERLDRLVPPGVILASNTSSISITTIGAATKRPDRVLGMHFMNPVPVMSLVELIRGQETADGTMQVARALCGTIGKTAVDAADYPGFIANRILKPGFPIWSWYSPPQNSVRP